MELTWLADTPQSRRRTRALRACPDCQRKKKRCRHLGSEASKPGRTLTTDISDHSRNTKRTKSSSQPPRNSRVLEEPFGLSPSASRIERFVGDLNPEAALREKVDAPDGAHHRDQVGLWINTPFPQNHGGTSDQSYDPAGARTDLLVHDSETQSVASVLNRRYLSALMAYDRLPRSTLDCLTAIYFSRINHILPLVDSESFQDDSAKEAASVFLERAICLVAAKDEAAGPNLRLNDDSAPVTARIFCSEIYNGLVCAIEAGLEKDRATRIRILALMSLHSEGYEGAEAASMHLCQAIHQAQTAGLHLERPHRLPEDALTNLFWCLWTMDKMHACLGGRPVLLADRDIGIKRHENTANQAKSAFHVWIALSELLSTVISFYRPFADDATGWETAYPSFEEIVGENVREDLDYATLGVLELYYHAISILSCRYRPSHRPGGSGASHIRQGLAAVRINSLVASECAKSLPPLPIVPYALSLSMGVSYHQFRSSKLITHFDRAKTSLETCCRSLEELGAFWCSAEAMARLGRKALCQIGGTSVGRDISRNHLLSTAMKADAESPIRNAPLNAIKPGIPESNARMSPQLCEANFASMDNSRTNMVQGQSALPLLEQQQDDVLQDTVGDGFANIDMLFDDFLDLSLPTNFWDPVFFPPGHSDDV